MARGTGTGKAKLEHARRVLIARARVAKLQEAGRKNKLDLAKARQDLAHTRKGG